MYVLKKKLILLVFVVIICSLEGHQCTSLADLIKENSLFLRNKIEASSSHASSSLNSDMSYDVSGNGASSDSALDTSVFGNTYESFFDFANRRTHEIESRNKDLYEKSMKACIYTPYAATPSVNNNVSEYSSDYTKTWVMQEDRF